MGRAIALLGLLLLALPVVADKQPRDGTYDARVRTDSGIYRVPVEIESGEVTHILWPNGGRMSVRGGEIDGDEATGRNSNGARISIELDDLEYDDSDTDSDDE